jgi:hypothetical protein
VEDNTLKMAIDYYVKVEDNTLKMAEITTVSPLFYIKI